MKKWTNRVTEEANLLNPAFIDSIIVSSINGSKQKDIDGLPYALLFLIPPIILHKETRKLLPRAISTSLATWLYENPIVKLDFYQRTIALKPYVKQALLFGFQHHSIDLNETGRVVSNISSYQLRKNFRTETDEAFSCIKRAKFIGRWFSVSGDAKTIMSLWGVKP